MEQVSTEEVKRRAERVGKEIDEVIEVSEGSLAVVAKCVRDVNETLAIHAAWTDERSDQIESRLGRLELGQISLTTRVDRLDWKVDKLDKKVKKLDKKVDRLDKKVEELDKKVDGLDKKVDGLDKKFEARFESMEGSMNRLTARVEEVLAFAIRDELKAEKDTKQ